MKQLLNRYKTHLTALFAVTALVGLVTVGGSVAHAAPVDVLTQCNSGSQVCQGTNGNTLYTIIRNVVNLLIFIIGIIAVIMIVIGGFRYTTSGGDGTQTKNARDTIIYAVVGLVIAIMSYAIVNFVLSRL